jgi:hypothetical protein
MTDEQKPSAAHFLRNRDAWIRSVLECNELTHVQARVGVHLAMRMSVRTQFCWPSIETIATSIGASQRSVISSIDTLDELRFIGVERKRNLGNKYWLRFKWQ